MTPVLIYSLPGGEISINRDQLHFAKMHPQYPQQQFRLDTVCLMTDEKTTYRDQMCLVVIQPQYLQQLLQLLLQVCYGSIHRAYEVKTGKRANPKS